MSRPGATETPEPIPAAHRGSDPSRVGADFLPNFCDPRIVLAVVLVAELLALTFSLVRPAGSGFLIDLAQLSVLLQWLGLTSAALLCGLRGRLAGRSAAKTTGAVLAVVLGNILLLSAAIVWAGRRLGDDGGSFALFPDSVWPFATRNLGIGLIVTCLLLRYLFVSHGWRQQVEAQARARIDALQARIRPHFLFNSMNTIAALTRTNPRRAEEAVEDLADLFRASLGHAGRFSTLADEIELARIYQRIEQHRLGARLQVDWDIGHLPATARLPTLTLQPLLENAILHGIEPLPDGGTIAISGQVDGQQIELVVRNPVGADSEGRHGQGIATANIRERLRLAFGSRGALAVTRTAAGYEVRLSFPRGDP
jgi:two-component system sensor histidine kinase AlgZ